MIIALTDLTQSCSILGSTAIIKDSNYNYLHNQRLGLVKDINEKVDSNFLYVFNNSTFRNHVIATKTGSTVCLIQHLKKRIYNFEVKFPKTYKKKIHRLNPFRHRRQIRKQPSHQQNFGRNGYGVNQTLVCRFWSVSRTVNL